MKLNNKLYHELCMETNNFFKLKKKLPTDNLTYKVYLKVILVLIKIVSSTKFKLVHLMIKLSISYIYSYIHILLFLECSTP